MLHNSSITTRWTTAADLVRVAETRWLSFGHGSRHLDYFALMLATDERSAPTDHILAERNGQAVGTATSLAMTMYIRGAAISCQGVAFVGTIPSERRAGDATRGSGVASTIMRAVLDEARRREHVVSALMPFRASFYEHFGYGIVERRVEWTVPTTILPSGPTDGWRCAKTDDQAAQRDCRQRAVDIGQCDMLRTEAGWQYCESTLDSSATFVHATSPHGVLDARLVTKTAIRDNHDILVVEEYSAASPDAMLSILRFLGKFADQYHSAEITLPADFPLDRVLRQTQLPHRRVAHPFATARPFTRMQLRVLNHSRLLESVHLPRHPAFQADIAVAESEGTLTRLHLQYDSGRLSVAHTTADPQFTCPDTAWSAIVTGDLPARTAVQLGLATTSDISIARNLDIFADGPAPFCNEYF